MAQVYLFSGSIVCVFGPKLKVK